jgi:hypothetical protein
VLPPITLIAIGVIGVIIVISEKLDASSAVHRPATVCLAISTLV